MNQNSLISGI